MTRATTWQGYLPRLPRRHWEGWFVIGIGATRGAVRWVKTTVFRARRATPLAAVEGLYGPGLVETLVGLADRVVAARMDYEPAMLAADPSSFDLKLGGALALRAEGSAVVLDAASEPGVGLGLRLVPVDHLGWARLPGTLTYFGRHGAARGTVTLGDARHEFAGLGVAEHAWGRSVPFDPAQLVPGRWHWDVLRFDDAGSGAAPASAAALWLPVPGAGPTGVRGFARLPGTPFGPARPGGLEYLQVSEHAGRRHPLRWRARLATPAGDYEYEAQAATPLAPQAPGGGFLGFTFTGQYTPHAGTARELGGTGFAECGGRAA